MPVLLFTLFLGKPALVGQVAQVDHAQWTRLLTKYVSADGKKVNYLQWIREKRLLVDYLAYLAAHPPKPGWSADMEKAYWINLYNAATIQLILQSYPVKSIKELGDGKPWDQAFIRVGNQLLSLNDIEHGILRKKWKDARIHFALNCASRSCPPLSLKAFQPQTLDQQLNEATRTFLLSKENNIAKNKVTLSPIFDWYRNDFGSIPAFIKTHTGIVLSPVAKIQFHSYDWRLNE